MKHEHPARPRILVIDDNEAIHEDLKKILAAPAAVDEEMQDAEEMLFGTERSGGGRFDLDSAYQGQDGLALLERSLAEGRPYAMAFVDVRMPPGWDGIETTTQLWRCDPDLQVVICTAYTDYSWREIVERLGQTHNFVILKKPFDNIEVVQLAHALVSKREATEAARARLEEAESEVRQRRQTERELLAALDTAEEAIRCKREFLATMSHELRTPLNAIIGYSEMLEEDARMANAPHLLSGLAKVQLAGRHLLELINDILDMSRIESGKMPIRTQAVPVKQIAQDVMALAAPLAARRGNRLAWTVEDPDLWMEVDETRFQQCLLNLLSNACKFTSRGEVTLEVSRGQASGREYLDWRVRDTGIGIAEENFGRLFQPFSQVDSAATRKFGGTGLGLAISQRLCAMMGGQISVESKPGEGSVFTIQIPLNSTHAAAARIDGPAACFEGKQ
jgi:signal transduction histidine kinase